MTVSSGIAPQRASVRIVAGVAAVRAAIADGTLHHHGPGEVPADRPSDAVAVVRAWAAGEDLDGQRRHCGVCAPSLTPRQRDRTTAPAAR
jgi:hypothetical protein